MPLSTAYEWSISARPGRHALALQGQPDYQGRLAPFTRPASKLTIRLMWATLLQSHLCANWPISETGRSHRDQGEASRASQPPHTVLLPPPTLVGSSRSAARKALAAAFGAFDAEHIELTCDVAKDEVSARHWLTQRYFSRCDIRHSLACVSGLVYPCGAQRHPR
jgi:hypothetical protein